MDKVIKHLRYLEKGGKPISKREGICREIYNKFGVLAVRRVMCLFSGWPESSRRYMYPVSHKELDPEKAYHRSKNLWSRWTQYGRARRRLCGWLATRLEENSYE